MSAVEAQPGVPPVVPKVEPQEQQLGKHSQALQLGSQPEPRLEEQQGVGQLQLVSHVDQTISEAMAKVGQVMDFLGPFAKQTEEWKAAQELKMDSLATGLEEMKKALQQQQAQQAQQAQRAWRAQQAAPAAAAAASPARPAAGAGAGAAAAVPRTKAPARKSTKRQAKAPASTSAPTTEKKARLQPRLRAGAAEVDKSWHLELGGRVLRDTFPRAHLVGLKSALKIGPGANHRVSEPLLLLAGIDPRSYPNKITANGRAKVFMGAKQLLVAIGEADD